MSKRVVAFDDLIDPNVDRPAGADLQRGADLGGPKKRGPKPKARDNAAKLTVLIEAGLYERLMIYRARSRRTAQDTIEEALARFLDTEINN